MTHVTNQPTDEHRTRQNSAEVTGTSEYASSQETSSEGISLGSFGLLGGKGRPGRANGAMRAAGIHAMQRTQGNRAVQRYTRRSRVPTASTEGDEQLATRIEAQSSSGSKLPSDAQARLESGLGADLSGVRIHTGGEAHKLARQMSATAFTTGQDIFFTEGSYDPYSADGLRILAHEATHTVQQATGPVEGTPSEGGVSVSDPSDNFEREAERASESVISGRSAELSSQRASSSSASSQGASVQRIYNPFAAAAEYVEEKVEAVEEAASDAYQGVKEEVVETYNDVSEGAGDLYEGAKETAGNVYEGAKSEVSEAYSDVKETAGNMYEGAKEGVSDAYSDAKVLAGDAYEGAKGLAKEAYDNSTTGPKLASELFESKVTVGPDGKPRKEASLFDRGINAAEKWVSEGAQSIAGEVSGVPIVGDLAQMGADQVSGGAEFLSGGMKALGGMAGGLTSMAADPIGAAGNFYKMGENLGPTGAFNPLRWGRAGYDVVTGKKSMGEVYDQYLDLENSAKQQGEFTRNMGNAIIDPYKQAWKDGRYMEIAGRATVDIGSLFLGAGEAGAVGKMGEAGDIAKVAEAADVAKMAETADMAKAAETADMAKAAEAADMAKAGQGADLGKAGQGADLGKMGEGGDLAKTGQGSAGGGGARSGGGGGGVPSGEGPLFPGLSDTEVGNAVDKSKSGTRLELPGQNPKSGTGLQDTTIKADPTKPISYHQNSKFKDIADAPHPTTEVRYHSENPNAPAGTYSQTNPTIQVNSGKGSFAQLPDGTWKRVTDMTPAERAAAGPAQQTQLYRLPDGTWKPINEMTEAEKAAAHYPAN